MIHFLESAVARLYTRSSDVVGAGVLVSDDLVLTCAHVISAALGLSYNQTLPADAQVQVDFPLLTEEFTCFATVTHFDIDTDVAGLHLTASLPAPIHPTPLVRTDELWRHAFGAVGFPADYDAGVWASGILLGRTAGGHMQLEDVKVPGYAVQGGFSGTPVWDEQINGVVGIVTAAESDRNIKAAFMIPTDELIAAWPVLATHSLTVGSRELLQAQLTHLEAAQRKSANPARFRPQIDTLRERLAKWDERINRQRERIAEGLNAQRQQLAAQRARREKRRLRVVGAPPLDVTTYFKDRRQDLHKLGQLLSEPTTRLVSVIGHGGMGKTALACKVLRDLEHQRWPYAEHNLAIDGIVYLSTRTAGISLERLFLDCTKLLEDEERERLRSVWTNPQLKTTDKINRLLETLRQGRYVILLDNLEDLLDDRGRFTDENLWLFFEQDLLRAPGTQLVVTSRIPLTLRSEIMRFDQKVELLKGLPVDKGVALLRELDPNGEYGLRDAPEAQLKKAVELTHGVPRALEVLAGILANDPFATLDEVLETFYAHEDVVQALIKENYKRLDHEARRVIEALAVFRKPVPPLAIDYLLEPFAPGLNIPSIVQRLTCANIVNVNRTAKTLTLHPIDQDYAYSQLPEEDEIDTNYTRQAVERHAADYYVQLRTPEETWESIEDLAPHLNEFEHRLQAEEYTDAYQVLNTIETDYLHLWGHYNRLIAMHETLLAAPLPDDTATNNLIHLGHAYYSIGKTNRAIELYERALATDSMKNDLCLRSATLRKLGRAYHVKGQLTRATQLYQEALDISQNMQTNSRESGILFGDLGLAYHHQAKMSLALGYYELALSIAWKSGDDRRKNLQFGRIGMIYLDLGCVDRAIDIFERALSIAREINDLRYESAWLSYLGMAYRLKGSTERASEVFERGLSIVRQIGDLRGEGIHLSRYGLIYHETAHNLEFQQRALAIGIEDVRERSYQLLRLSKALLTTGEISQAYTACREAVSLDVQSTNPQSRWVLSVLHLHQSPPQAYGAFVAAQNASRAVLHETSTLYKPRYTLAAALVGQAICEPLWVDEEHRSNLLAPALDEYRHALSITAAPGIVQDAIRDLELIRAAGIEGLEPVFDLLESAEYKPDIPEDLPDLDDLIG